MVTSYSRFELSSNSHRQEGHQMVGDHRRSLPQQREEIAQNVIVLDQES